MDITPRTATVGVTLALLASVVAGPEEQQAVPIAQPAARAQSSAAEPVLGIDLDLDRFKRARKEEPVPDLFAPRSFAPPPLAAAAPNAKPPPAAPPLPFRYLGRIIDGERTSVFVSRGDEPYIIEPGQRIDPQYQVGEVTETAVTFVYLPLGIRQTLLMPASN